MKSFLTLLISQIVMFSVYMYIQPSLSNESLSHTPVPPPRIAQSGPVSPNQGPARPIRARIAQSGPGSPASEYVYDDTIYNFCARARFAGCSYLRHIILGLNTVRNVLPKQEWNPISLKSNPPIVWFNLNTFFQRTYWQRLEFKIFFRHFKAKNLTELCRLKPHTVRNRQSEYSTVGS